MGTTTVHTNVVCCEMFKILRCVHRHGPRLKNAICQRWCATKSRPTIFALSSGIGRCAVAVVRISGPKSREVCLKMARLRENQLVPRKAVVRRLFDPVSGELLDNGLMLWFPSPSSFTGEDCVELHIHGGVAVVSSVLSGLHKMPSFRMAEAGEFTKRAFMAGKLDATAVEGLADLLRAETDAQRRQALRQATGELAALYNKWRTVILQTMAHLEAFVDFGEDQDIGREVVDSLQQSVRSLMREVAGHLNDNRRGERLRSGVKVAIIGEPNVGKSSLINVLSRRNVAIVSPYAGTTRDILEISLDVGGYPIVLCDTAGLRLSDDPIEVEGLKRAKEAASSADLVIVVIDASRRGSLLQQSISLNDFVSQECDRLQVKLGGDTERMLLVNKLDLVKDPPVDCSPVSAISCKTEQGLDNFLARLESKLAELCANPQTEAPLITSSRQRDHLRMAYNHLTSFTQFVDRGGDLALAGEQLRKAARQIGSITAGGKIGTEEMLDVLFQSFCIGK